MTQAESDMEVYFSGEKLYGDDFTPEQIQQWFESEKEAYAELRAKNQSKYRYIYHALNYYHGFRFLSEVESRRILGVGSAYGDELHQVLSSASQITILEPSTAFVQNKIGGVQASYVKPNPNGDLPFEDNGFELITCFGVLHHIPNVTKVVSEFYRCLAPAGYVLLREPIVSMGDWRKPRKGLTSMERGIPSNILRKIILSVGFTIVREKKCMTHFPSRLQKWTGKPAYNNTFIVAMDSLLSTILAWNDSYHPVKWYTKLRPLSVFYVLSKD